MKKISVLVFLFSLLLSYSSCEHSRSGIMDSPPEENFIRPLSSLETDLVEADTKFSFKVFRSINSEDPSANLFISPLSISMALGMTLNGADGATKDAMRSTLEFEGLTNLEINESYKSLIELLTNLDKDVLVQIANSTWYREGLELEQDFIDYNMEYFNSPVTGLDFDDPSASGIMNDWVNDKTNGKIEKIVPDEIDATVMLYLINAVYYNAIWKYQFNRDDTIDGEFTLSDGSTKTCKMMRRKGKVRYAQHDSFIAVDIPYGSEKYSMTILMPEDISGLNDLINTMEPGMWSSIVNSLSEHDDTKLALPKFKLEYEISLVDVLKSLGMEIAFSDNADFSNITTDLPLFISEVLHKTYIDVNEVGTEASAATSVEISYLSIANPSISINRPFVFVIGENNTGAILFMGKILEPEYN